MLHLSLIPNRGHLQYLICIYSFQQKLANMKTVIIASLVASAAAFVPAQEKVSVTSLAAFEDELGVQVSLLYAQLMR